MRYALAVLGMLLATGSVWAKPMIRCTSAGRAPVTVNLDSRRFEGQSMSCILGDFISDMTPCAPDGKFSLSAPTGDAAIVEVVGRWQDYAGHLGGVASFSRTPDAYSFSGGDNSPTGGFKEGWRFTIDRLSGGGKLTRKGKPDVAYRCVRAAAKL